MMLPQLEELHDPHFFLLLVLILILIVLIIILLHLILLLVLLPQKLLRLGQRQGLGQRLLIYEIT